MKIDIKSINKKLVVFAQRVAKEAKLYIQERAYDTGDMMRAVTVGELKETPTGCEIEVFVDPNKLYNKRVKYKSSVKRYPVYVHEGTSKMDARPFFSLSFEKVKPDFKDIMPKIKVENGSD